MEHYKKVALEMHNFIKQQPNTQIKTGATACCPLLNVPGN